MPTFRFVHAADLHLDTPFEGIAGGAPHLGASLRDASLAAWDALVDLCLAERAAFLLIAGDVYDGAERGVRAQLRFRKGLERLAEQGIPAFIVHGNHDPVDEGWSAIRTWPDTVTVFGSRQVASIPAVRDGRQLATIHGISYPRADCEENLTRRFPAVTPALETQGLQIGLLHCNAIASGDHAAYSPCSVADLQRSTIDYWALGHVHRRQHVLQGPVWASYPGNLQGRSPKPSEMGAKGALVVDVVDDSVRDVRFAPCDRLRFHAVQVDVGCHADLSSVRDALAAAAAAAHRAADGRGLLVRGLLIGRGVVHRDLASADALADLLESLREDGSGGTPPSLWWESLRDATGAALDRDAIAARGDFSAELLVRAAGLREDPGGVSRLLGTPPAELRRRAGRFLELDAERAQELVDAAETQALDLLEAGGQAAAPPPASCRPQDRPLV